MSVCVYSCVCASVHVRCVCVCVCVLAGARACVCSFTLFLFVFGLFFRDVYQFVKSKNMRITKLIVLVITLINNFIVL